MDGVHSLLPRRTRPLTPLGPGSPTRREPQTGIRPCYSGLQVQGTSGSPSSTASMEIVVGRRDLCQRGYGCQRWGPPTGPQRYCTRPHFLHVRTGAVVSSFSPYFQSCGGQDFLVIPSHLLTLTLAREQPCAREHSAFRDNIAGYRGLVKSLKVMVLMHHGCSYFTIRV